MSPGRERTAWSLTGDHDQSPNKFFDRLDRTIAVLESEKAPLLPLVPQETQAYHQAYHQSGEVRPWVETPFPVPPMLESIVSSSSGVSFSLQSYLNDENGLEKCMVGATEQQPPSERRYTTPPVAVRVDTRGCSPIADAGKTANTALSSLDWLQANGREFREMPAISTCAAEDGTDTNIHEDLSLDSWSSRSTAPSAVSSTFSANRWLLDDASIRVSVSARHAELHRQLEEAGLSGLGDGSCSLELYHRAAARRINSTRVSKPKRVVRRKFFR